MVGRVPGAAAVPWKQWPGMAMNPDFDAQLRAPCRRAKRCCAAAACAPLPPPNGYRTGAHRHNILEGFEGDRTTTASAAKGRLAFSRPALAAGLIARPEAAPCEGLALWHGPKMK